LLHSEQAGFAGYKAMFYKSPEALECVNFIRYMRNEVGRLLTANVKQILDEKAKDHNVASFFLEANHLVGLGEPEIIDDFITLFMVMDNAAKQMLVCLAQILRHPEIYQKVEEECLANELGDFDSLFKYKYLEMVIFESLRWSPALVRGNRQSSGKKPFTLGGYQIPARSRVQYSIWVTHHSDEFWENPEKFDPERFRDGIQSVKPWSYIPFAGGPRTCLGKHLAMMMMKLSLVDMFQKFHISKVAGEKVDIDLRNTLIALYDGNNALLTPREATA